MTVEFFNLPYFFFILLGAGSIVGLYFLLRNKSDRTKKIVLFSILILNVLVHFSKPLYAPYDTMSTERIIYYLFINNICGVSVFAFPLMFLCKNEGLRSFMFYLGVISGGLALLIPTEALGKEVWTFNLWRFYICHVIIILVPLLMVLLKVHKPNWRNVWKMPFYMLGIFMIIMTSQILQAELGITNWIEDRAGDFFNVNFTNNSLFWTYEQDMGFMFAPFTPEFMKVVPFGPHAGEPKWWPIFWVLPALFFYFWLLPLLLCLPWQWRQIGRDMKFAGSKVKYAWNKMFKRKAPAAAGAGAAAIVSGGTQAPEAIAEKAKDDKTEKQKETEKAKDNKEKEKRETLKTEKKSVQAEADKSQKELQKTSVKTASKTNKKK